MANFFINRPIVAIVIAMLTTIIGLVALSRLPTAQYPNVVPPQILASTTYTGADALTIEHFGYEGDHYENFPDRFEVAYRLEFEAFFRTLAEGGVPAPGPDDALETLRLALAARRSWLEGKPVRVDDITAEVPA